MSILLVLDLGLSVGGGFRIVYRTWQVTVIARFNVNSMQLRDDLLQKYVCYNLCVCILNISGSSYDVVKTYEKKHHFVSDFIQGPYNYDLFDDYCLWLSEGLLASHMNK